MDLEGWESFGQKEEHQSGGRNETDQEVVGAGRERRRKPVKEVNKRGKRSAATMSPSRVRPNEGRP